eukprot:scaffold517165_cov18-Prasinocladus_malaysianus.AAC.1
MNNKFIHYGHRCGDRTPKTASAVDACDDLLCLLLPKAALTEAALALHTVISRYHGNCSAHDEHESIKIFNNGLPDNF